MIHKILILFRKIALLIKLICILMFKRKKAQIFKNLYKLSVDRYQKLKKKKNLTSYKVNHNLLISYSSKHKFREITKTAKM
jgi:hypothetical protein